MVRFVDHFWGERNKGFDELILNFKKSYLSIEEFNKFLVESINVETSYCRLLSRLASCLTNKFTVSSCFYPIGDALRQYIEEISCVHDSVIAAFNNLIEDFSKYQADQKLKQKQVKEEESKTAELISSLNTNYNAVIKSKHSYYNWCSELHKVQTASPLFPSQSRIIDKLEKKVRIAEQDYRNLISRYSDIQVEFENKFTDSCNKFQEIEEAHLQRMKNFCIAYTDAYLTCSENLRETRRKFIFKCDQLSIDSILLAFVHSRKTGNDRPPILKFEEYSSTEQNLNVDNDGVKSTINIENIKHKSNLTKGGVGSDPFFPALFMGLWRSSRDTSRRIYRKQKTLDSHTSDLETSTITNNTSLRSQTADISDIVKQQTRPDKSILADSDDSSFISRYSTNSHNIQEYNEPIHSLHRWSSSSLSSDEEELSKLHIDIKPASQFDSNYKSDEALQSIKNLFSKHLPTRRDIYTDPSRSASAAPFLTLNYPESVKPLSIKTAPCTPVTEEYHNSADKRASLIGSDETLCPQHTNLDLTSTNFDQSERDYFHLETTSTTPDVFNNVAMNNSDPWGNTSFSRASSICESDGEFSSCYTSPVLSPTPTDNFCQIILSNCEAVEFEVGIIEAVSESGDLKGALVISFQASNISHPLTFELSGLQNASKIFINRKLVSLNAIVSSDVRRYDLRIDKLNNILGSKNPNNSNFVNLNLMKYKCPIIPIDKWIYVNYHSPDDGYTHYIEFTALDRLTHVRIRLINIDLSELMSKEGDYSFADIAFDEILECRINDDQAIGAGDSHIIKFTTLRKKNLSAIRVSFRLTRKTFLSSELMKPFGESSVHFQLCDITRNVYKVKHLCYKVTVDNYATMMDSSGRLSFA
ncbi:hypothetical protein GJ496_001238 [Pomphorhynchus laevis]|nr:hypothetical protein GJ496_001238 [Pomphorhynchus laevis]